MAKYSYRDSHNRVVPFRCDLEDKVVFRTDFESQSVRIGEVIALDDDGYITIQTPDEQVRTHNLFIIGKAGIDKDCTFVYGRKWLYEVLNFKPNTNWQNNEHYNNDGYDDWLVGEFSEGDLWMNNNEGYIVLCQHNGVNLFTYI